MHEYDSRWFYCPSILLIALLLPTDSTAQNGPIERSQILTEESASLRPDSTSAEMAAQWGLELVHNLKDVEDDVQYAKFLGFASTQQARQASLGNPLQVFSVASHQLVNFQDDDVPSTFFSDTHTVTYPLEAAGHAVSSVSVVSHSNNTWSLARLGSAKFIKTVEKYRTSSLNLIIVIQDLGLRFLADRTDGKPTLIPLFDRPSFDIREGTPVSAREISMKLKGHLPVPNHQLQLRSPPAP